MITNSGQRLGERYVLQDRLAVGGMGEVWSAIDEVLNRPVAVKVLRTDLAPDSAFQARFRAEARTAAALSHGGIAAVYDYGEALGSAYLVMELVPGVPLSAMITEEGALGTDRTLQIVAQAARALHAAHRHGVIHRDIKPANLMVTPELRVKVTDFGIARPRDHEPLTATGQVMGTAHYLAPELARGEIASPLSDVYALGVVAYECLAGWRPFDGDNQVAVATAHLQDEPPPLPQTIPAEARNIVMAAMAKNPAERPQGANALAALMEDLRLRSLAGGAAAQPVEAEPIQAWPADAVTPPRGIQPPPATRREAAERRGAAGASPGPSAAQGDSYPAAEAYPPASGYPGSGYPAAGHTTPGFAAGGNPAPGSTPAPGYPPARPAPGDRFFEGQEPARPVAGLAAEAYPKKPRASHSRNPRSTSPTTSQLPASRSAGRPPRRMSIPLAALIVLVVVIALGSLWARHRDSGDKPHSLGVHGSSAVLLLAPAGFRSGGQNQIHGTTTEGWNW